MRRLMRVGGLLVWMVLLAALASAQRLESAHSAAIENFASVFPPPGHNEDQLREHWTPRLIEQLVCDFPNDGFGWKRADSGRPLSSDAIARRYNGRIYAYDVILSAGTGGWRLDSTPDVLDISGQVFVPMSCVDHLGDRGGSNPPPSNPPPTNPPAANTDLTPILVRLDQLQVLQQQLVVALSSVAAALEDVRRINEDSKAHDLVLADEVRQAKAAIEAAAEKVRAEIARGVRVRF